MEENDSDALYAVWFDSPIPELFSYCEPVLAVRLSTCGDIVKFRKACHALMTVDDIEKHMLRLRTKKADKMKRIVSAVIEYSKQTA